MSPGAVGAAVTAAGDAGGASVLLSSAGVVVPAAGDDAPAVMVGAAVGVGVSSSSPPQAITASEKTIAAR
jgi:hypothetical protein